MQGLGNPFPDPTREWTHLLSPKGRKGAASSPALVYLHSLKEGLGFDEEFPDEEFPISFFFFGETSLCQQLKPRVALSFKKKKKFIYSWLRWAFVTVRRLSLVVMSGLLIAVASLVAEHRLQGARAR